MIQGTYRLWSKEEYAYPVIGEFIPNVVTYIHEDDVARPAILIVPGGGYNAVSNSEGEIVAKEFYNKGYNTFVVTYTTSLLATTPLKHQPLKDLSQAVRLVRSKAETFRIDPNKVTVCGFSAGGHLCGSLAVHYQDPVLLAGEGYKGFSNRPDAVILSYPVISSGEYAHPGSFAALLGTDATQEELTYMSLETQVTKDMPPVFLWHTATDELVSVENSYLFANACKEQGVPYELHVFADGPHGMSLANQEWASGDHGGEYTMQQFLDTLQYAADHRLPLPAPFDRLNELPRGANVREMLRQGMSKHTRTGTPNESVALWPELAHYWLKKLFAM